MVCDAFGIAISLMHYPRSSYRAAAEWFPKYIYLITLFAFQLEEYRFKATSLSRLFCYVVFLQYGDAENGIVRLLDPLT